MRKVLSTGSFWVFSVLGFYYILTFFGVPSDVPTSDVYVEKTQSEGFGAAINDGVYCHREFRPH